MQVQAEFTKNGSESCHNKNVSAAIKFATEQGKRMFAEPTIKACKEAIRAELSGYANVCLQTKRATCVSPVLIKGEQILTGEIQKICHDMNGFMSEIINNYDRIESGDIPALEADYNDKLQKIIGFGIHPSTLSMRPESDTSEYFAKRWSWYNQSVNFEHVCFVIACVLANKVCIRDNELDCLLYPFLYFITKYREHKNELVYFVYHLIKLIRVYFTRAAEPEARFWNPVTYMTNLRFGSFIDPNVEIYGNIRLGTKPNDIMSMFSNAPRSTAETDEKAVWFNWNDITPIILQFSTESEDIWRTTFGIKEPGNRIKHILHVFDYLTKADILPRSKLVRNDCINLYHRCVINKDAEDKDEILTAAVIDFLNTKNFDTFYIGRKLSNCRVGITYFEGPEIKSRVLNITLSDLTRCVERKMKTETHPETCAINPYIVKCYIDSRNRIRRDEHGISDYKFKELLEVINKTKDEIETLFK